MGFLGGAALIIEDGRAVATEDLRDTQHFHRSKYFGDGIDAAQFRDRYPHRMGPS